TATKLLTYAENVLQKTKDNADLFADAAETIVLLETAVEAYRNGLVESAYRDRRQVVIKNQQAETLKRVLHTHALYVESVSAGDPNVILAAGFIPSQSTVSPTVGASPRSEEHTSELQSRENLVC